MSAYKFESWTICKTEHQIFLYQGIEPIDKHEKIDVCRVSELEKLKEQLKQKDAEIERLKKLNEQNSVDLSAMESMVEKIEKKDAHLKEAVELFEKCADFNHSYDDICWMQDDKKLKDHCEKLRQIARSAWEKFRKHF